MIPEERARKIITLTGDHKEVYAICNAGHHRLYFESGNFPRPASEIAASYVEAIAKAIAAAEADEREACAEVAEAPRPRAIKDHRGVWIASIADIAAAIRARGKQ